MRRDRLKARGYAIALLAALAWTAGAATTQAAPQRPSSSASPAASAAGLPPVPLAGAAAAGDPGSIAFDELDLDTTVTDQYADHGVVFTSDVFTSDDNSNPTEPVLSGRPRFFGDIVAIFTEPGTATPTTVDGFSLDVGFIDDRNSVEIQYHDAAGNVVGATRAQSHGINRIDVTYRGVAGFKVSAVEYEAAGFAIDNLVVQRGARGVRPTRMASLGDSYTSGEGLVPGDGLRYDCGTDLHAGRYYEHSTVLMNWSWVRGIDCDTRTGSTDPPRYIHKRRKVHYENRCHRHGRAYPNQIREQLGLAPANGLFVACSGATTDHIGALEPKVAKHPNSPPGVHGGQTQLANLTDFAAGGAPELITVGIGGNDANFGGIVAECVNPFGGCDEPDFATRAISTINGTMFRRVRDTLVALRQAHPPPATIVAFGYPSVIDDPVGCSAARGVSDGEWAWIKTAALPAINAAVKDAATEAGAVYIDIKDVTAGHGVCSADPWINGLRAGDDAWFVARESFHPNQRAHDAIARFFLDRHTDGGVRLLAAPPEPSDPIRPATGPEIRLGHVDVGAGRRCGADCLQPAACVETCHLHVQGEGFTPGASMQAILHSDPVDLGQVTADGEGRVDASLRIPRGVPAGDHTLVIEGMAADGTRQRAVEPVRVSRRVRAKIAGRFRGGRRGAQVRALTVKRLSPDARVRVVCARGATGVAERIVGGRPRGRGAKRARRATRRIGCPFAQRSFRVRAGKGKRKAGAAAKRRTDAGAKRTAKRRAGAKRRSAGGRRGRSRPAARQTLSLSRHFRRRLAPGTVVRVLVTQPEMSGRSLDVRIRKGRKKPKLARQCTDPGELVPGRC